MKKNNVVFLGLVLFIILITMNTNQTYAFDKIYEDEISTEVQEIPDEIIQEYEEKATIQLEATQAYDTLSDTFIIDEDGFVTYPEDYAGAWIEGSTLHIALTSLVDTTYYDDMLSNFNCIEYSEAEFSLNQLEYVQQNIFSLLSRSYNNEITEYYVDVETNKMVFEVEKFDDEITQEVEAVLETRALNRVNIPIDIDNVEIIVGEKIQTEAKLYGGRRIRRKSADGPGRTIGVCGTITTTSGKTYSGIITAGHNLAVSGGNQTIYRAGEEFGKVCLLMYKENGNGDWAAVRKTNSDTLTNKIYGSSTSYTRNITSTVNDVAKGTYIMKYGATNGYANGTVKAQNVTVIDGTYTIKGITKCSLSTGASSGGDSGGPYYTLSSKGGDNYNFAGVHQGSSGSGNNKMIYFTPYTRFKSYFKVKTS